MSIRDADLCEELLHRIASRQPRIRVLEWGSGRSTIWYPGYLGVLDHPFTWVTVEHNRRFFQAEVLPRLTQESSAVVIPSGDPSQVPTTTSDVASGLTVFVFDGSEVRPDLPDREADRGVNLDGYVALPSMLETTFDLIIIDGRKRRRCLLKARNLLSTEGYVVLHDAWRKHYSCACQQYPSGRRFGDECWIGSSEVTDFIDVLPWHAFERHEDGPDQSK